MSAAPQSSPERLSALRLGCWFALLQGDVEPSQALRAEATELAAQVGNATEEAYLTHVPGMAALYSGKLDRADTLLSDALSRFRTAGILRGELFSLFMLGLTLGLKGQRHRGLTLIRECIEKTSQLGDEYWQSWALWATAHIEVLHSALDVAAVAAKNALRMQQPQDNRLGMVFVLDTLAWIAERRERHTRAATLFGAADAMFHAIGTAPDNYLPFATPHYEHVARARAALGEHAYQQALNKGYALPQAAAIEYALETTTPDEAPRTSRAIETTLTRREREIADVVA